MIIYNKNKEFIGIDETDLKALGFKNLAALQAEAGDFADLFVKTPGHVHNFKHVHWIDFVLCAKSTDESKAIVHANDKSFKVNIEIKIIYLTDAPATKAYIIILHNLRSLSSNEKTEIATELQTRAIPVPSIPNIHEQANDLVNDEFDSKSAKEIVQDPYAIVQEDQDHLDIYEPSQEELDDIGDAEVEDAPSLTHNVPVEKEILLEDELGIVDEIHIQTPPSEIEPFVFDPQKTAEILEMPVSLIEEFIEDFIAQAIDFKDRLYAAVSNDDMIELQALSHKLKGVAANLRVQDALEILNKINKSKDFTTSKRDLNTFYKIISQLSGKEIIPIQEPSIKTNELDIKDDSDELLEIMDDLEEDDEILEVLSDDYDALEIDFDEEETEDIQEDQLLISDDFDMLDDAMNDIIQEKENKEEFTQDTSYDKIMVASEIGLDHSSFNELFDDYISESQNLIMSIEEAIESKDTQAWKNIAITLKGMSDNMRINNFVPQLETLLTTNDADDAKVALQQIQTIIFEILKTKD